MEKEIIERAFAEGWVRPRPPASRTGKTVAVVGTGPAGLAAAAQLNQAGHTVTVYERATAPGGLLRYGIPDFKLEKSVHRAAGEAARGRGRELPLRAWTWARRRASTSSPREHDAVVLAIGARRPRELEVPGRELPGVV